MSKFLSRSGAFTKTGMKKTDKQRPPMEDEENVEEEERWWRRMEGDREADYGLVEGEGQERDRKAREVTRKEHRTEMV